VTLRVILRDVISAFLVNYGYARQQTNVTRSGVSKHNRVGDNVVTMVINSEQELLFRCLGKGEQPVCAESDEIDWHLFLDLAQAHNVVPIVAARLRDLSRGDIPVKVSETLQSWQLESTRHNMALVSELAKILESLLANQVTGIAFKGPVTAMMAYGDLSLRTCGDLDILVRGEEFPKALTILQSNGYTVTNEHEPVMQVTLGSAESGVSIDMHWGLPPKEIKLNVGLLRDNLAEINIYGKSIRTFSFNDMFLIHCINATKEYWHPTLQQFYDLKMFSQNRNLDWLALLKRAGEIGCKRMTRAALLAAHKITNLDLPKRMLDELERCAYAGRVAQEIENHIFNWKEWKNNEPTVFSGQDAYFTALLDSFFVRTRERARNIKRAITTENDWQ